MQFILNKIIQNTKETLQVPSCADASARATVYYTLSVDIIRCDLWIKDGATVFAIWQFVSRKCKQHSCNCIFSSMHNFYDKYIDYMCKGEDYVNYDVYMNIGRLIRKK